MFACEWVQKYIEIVTIVNYSYAISSYSSSYSAYDSNYSTRRYTNQEFYESLLLQCTTLGNKALRNYSLNQRSFKNSFFFLPLAVIFSPSDIVHTLHPLVFQYFSHNSSIFSKQSATNNHNTTTKLFWNKPKGNCFITWTYPAIHEGKLSIKA